MKRETFIKLVENYDSHDEILISKMALLIEKYPYFQLPRFLYTKSLKDQNKNDLDISLNQLALFTADRVILKKNIESKFELQKKVKKRVEDDKPPIQTSQSSDIKSKNFPAVNERPSRKKTASPKTKIKVADSKKENNKTKKTKNNSKKSTPARENLKLSFIDWVQFTEEKQNQNSVLKEFEKDLPLNDKLNIIDRFIEADPKIRPVGENQTIDIVTKDEFNTEELMTETLAKVLVKQKKYKKAISAYKILSLKYPEKNVFFAGQIQKIRNLQQQ